MAELPTPAQIEGWLGVEPGGSLTVGCRSMRRCRKGLAQVRHERRDRRQAVAVLLGLPLTGLAVFLWLMPGCNMPWWEALVAWLGLLFPGAILTSLGVAVALERPWFALEVTASGVRSLGGDAGLEFGWEELRAAVPLHGGNWDLDFERGRLRLSQFDGAARVVPAAREILTHRRLRREALAAMPRGALSRLDETAPEPERSLSRVERGDG